VLTYVARRILFSIPVLFATSFLVFTLASALGDPLYVLRQNPLASKVTIAHIAAAKHLNDPIPLRYLYWLKDVFTKGFGEPLLAHHPIWRDLVRVLPHTIQLVASSELVALAVGVAIGIYAAIRQYSFFDYAATTLSFLGFSMPVFWLALMLQVLFTNLFLKTHVRIFYTSGLSSVPTPHGAMFVIDRIQHLALPVMVLSTLSIALHSRFMRAALLDVVNSDYVRTARAKGLAERRVVLRHAVRNALTPVVTVSALNLGGLLGGAIVTETIFQLDGMGPYFIQNLNNGDVYPVMAWLMVAGASADRCRRPPRGDQPLRGDESRGQSSRPPGVCARGRRDRAGQSYLTRGSRYP
jgi:peptide/nickel transport system permease protein